MMPMMSGISPPLGLHGGELVGTEGIGQQLGHGPRTGSAVDDELGPSVLEEKLAAASARHQNFASRVAHRHGDKTPATLGK